MNFVVLGVVAVLLLAGLALLAAGNKGWSWGTVVAGVLVLLAATGYFFLAARVAQRNRAWSQVILRKEAELLLKRDGQRLTAKGALEPAADMPSLLTLRDLRRRLGQIVDRVNTWRGGSVTEGAFQTDGDAQDRFKIEIELPAPLEAKDNAADRKPPIHQGAEIAVFDAQNFEEGGRFLGLFQVTDAAVDAAANRCSLTVVPLGTPDEADRARRAKAYDKVLIYEELPSDRWLAFHRTPQAGEADTTAVVGDPEKMDVEELLKDLERLSAQVVQHETALEEDEWQKIVASVEAGEKKLPGTYWARVEFTKDHALTTAGANEAGPAEKGDDGAENQPAAEREEGKDEERPGPAEEAEDRVRQFIAGDTAEFDLETAVDLKKADVAKITAVMLRRPLTDAYVLLRGGQVLAARGADQPARRADGLETLLAMMRKEIAALDASNTRLEAAIANIETQTGVATDDTAALEKDAGEWDEDIAAATRLVEAFERRLATVSAAAEETTTTIVKLGREYTRAMGLLAEKIDRAAPPPVRRAQPGSAPVAR
jgi:hypothetical protein